MVAFLLGAGVTGVAVASDRWRELREATPVLLWVEAGLILAAALLPLLGLGDVWRTATIGGFLAAAMGCQNRTGVILAGGKARTTHVTGTLTDLGYHAGRLVLGSARARASRAEDAAAAYRLFALFAGFLTGGLVGCVLLKVSGAVDVAAFAMIPAMAAAVISTRMSGPART